MNIKSILLSCFLSSFICANNDADLLENLAQNPHPLEFFAMTQAMLEGGVEIPPSLVDYSTRDSNEYSASDLQALRECFDSKNEDEKRGVVGMIFPRLLEMWGAQLGKQLKGRIKTIFLELSAKQLSPEKTKGRQKKIQSCIIHYPKFKEDALAILAEGRNKRRKTDAFEGAPLEAAPRSFELNSLTRPEDFQIGHVKNLLASAQETDLTAIRVPLVNGGTLLHLMAKGGGLQLDLFAYLAEREDFNGCENFQEFARLLDSNNQSVLDYLREKIDNEWSSLDAGQQSNTKGLIAHLYFQGLEEYEPLLSKTEDLKKVSATKKPSKKTAFGRGDIEKSQTFKPINHEVKVVEIERTDEYVVICKPCGIVTEDTTLGTSELLEVLLYQDLERQQEQEQRKNAFNEALQNASSSVEVEEIISTYFSQMGPVTWQEVLDNWKSQRPNSRPCLVHRLDKGTSGCLILALTPEFAARAAHTWKNKEELSKVYYAVVVGSPEQDAGRAIFSTGAIKAGGHHMMVPVSSGRKNITDWTVCGRLDETESRSALTLIKFKIHTGITHQIRTLCAYVLKVGILGDHLYACQGGLNKEFRYSLGNKRIMLLHAAYLELPSTLGPDMQFTAEFPYYWEPYLNQIVVAHLLKCQRYTSDRLHHLPEAEEVAGEEPSLPSTPN